MYATVRVYEMSDDWDDGLVDHLENGFLPSVERVPGFVAYYSLEAGPRVFASVTICQDRQGAEASNQLAREYVQRHLADRFTGSPEVTAGPVRASRVAPPA